MKTILLCIDPQIDFCDPKGSLYVPGANKDMERLAKLINHERKNLDDIICTLDQHYSLHIAHPIMWKDVNNKHPNPFTVITHDDVIKGKWQMSQKAIIKAPEDGKFMPWDEYYTMKLKQKGKCDLTIWPPHCIIGSQGAAVYPKLHEQFILWEKERFGIVDYVTKGSNFRTEHYSVVKAEVPDMSDPNTELNIEFINVMQYPEIETILIAGEALSHCVANTINDIFDNIIERNIRKFVLLEDCCSSVPGFEKHGEEFKKSLIERGARIMKSTEWINR